MEIGIEQDAALAEGVRVNGTPTVQVRAGALLGLGPLRVHMLLLPCYRSIHAHCLCAHLPLFHTC